MEYLLNMGFAGSFMWVFYLLIKQAAKGRFSESWRCVTLKCTLLYYLIPIPFMKKFYSFILKHIVFTEEVQEWVVSYTDEDRVLFTAQDIYLDPSLKQRLMVGGILTGIAALAFFYVIGKYKKQRKMLLKCGGIAAKDTQNRENYKALQESVGLRRDIIYIDSTLADRNEKTAFTMGIWKPVILYPAKRSPQEIKLILEHELHHVKNRDVLWRMLLNIARILHFYNPFVWFFAEEFELVSEVACDAEVVRNKGEQERREYAELLLEMAQENSSYGMWSVGISRKKKKVRERMENVMKREKKYFKGVVSAMLVGAAIFLSSFTAFAYDDVNVWVSETEETEKFFQLDVAFAPEGTDFTNIEFMNDFEIKMDILYDVQFVDEAGNVYKINNDGDSVMWWCTNHECVDGTLSEHERNSNGGCTITFYKAKRCTKCGMVFKGEEIDVVTHKVCTH